MQTLGTHRSLSEIRMNVFLQGKKSSILAILQLYAKSYYRFGSMLSFRRVQVFVFFFSEHVSVFLTHELFCYKKCFHFVIICVQKEDRKLIDAINCKMN